MFDVAWCVTVNKLQVLLQQPGRKDKLPGHKVHVNVLRISFFFFTFEV
jgi:hypothetical protein